MGFINAGYKLESQRSNKVIFQVQGHVSRAKHGFIPIIGI